MVHTMKLSKNPADYIFVICKSFDDGWCAAITPEDFFSREGHMYDQHLPLNIPGWGCDMQGYYSCEADLSAREMHDDLISKGFAFSQDFAEFLADHGGGEIFIPGITEYLAPPKPTDIYYLSEYNWERGTLISTGKKSHKVLCNPPWLVPHTRYIPKEKCAFPGESVCVVWEQWKGKNGRGGYRVERVLYPQQRIPAEQISRQHMGGGNGRVSEP